jgi:hypothetical protein
VKTVMNFRFHKSGGIAWIAEWLFASEEEFCFMGSVSQSVS